jgi:hypothetical protein
MLRKVQAALSILDRKRTCRRNVVTEEKLDIGDS